MKRISGTARVMNALLTPLSGGRKRPDRAWGRIVDKALEKTGGSLDGNQAFVADYRYLFDRFLELDLSPVGWMAVQTEAQGRLENRFRIEKVHAEHPEVAEEEIEAPIFVTGLPRTATTLTHNIIASSDGHRGPLLWELHWTDLEVDDQTRADRIKSVQRMTDGLVKFAPNYDLIHPLRSDKPEECVYILPHGIHHLARATMPDYFEWLGERDYEDDYRYLKRALQVLQHGRPRRRWVLKTPMHLSHLDVLARVFPDAKIVWTHRDPITVLGSVCSLVETTSLLHLKRADPHAIGEMWIKVLPSAIDRAREIRPSLPADMVVDVAYHAVASDPWTNVPPLYERLGAQWTDADNARLDKVMERPIRDRRHEYTLSRYGLEPDQALQAFGDYSQLTGT